MEGLFKGPAVSWQPPVKQQQMPCRWSFSWMYADESAVE